MPRSAIENERVREATQTAIVDSAMTLFGRNGYAHTTTRNIAREAGISTGLMYHYFDSKEALLRAVFDRCMGILGDAFAMAYGGNPPGTRIAALVRAMVTLLESDREFWSVFTMLRTQPAIMAQLGDHFLDYTAQLRQLFVAELQALGRADPELDAYLLYCAIEGVIQQYLLDPDHFPLRAVTGRVIEQFGR